MSRWAHEVRVHATEEGLVQLHCACTWTSRAFDRSTVSLLAQVAQDHRRHPEEKP